MDLAESKAMNIKGLKLKLEELGWTVENAPVESLDVVWQSYFKIHISDTPGWFMLSYRGDYCRSVAKDDPSVYLSVSRNLRGILSDTKDQRLPQTLS